MLEAMLISFILHSSLGGEFITDPQSLTGTERQRAVGLRMQEFFHLNTKATRGSSSRYLITREAHP